MGNIDIGAFQFRGADIGAIQGLLPGGYDIYYGTTRQGIDYTTSLGHVAEGVNAIDLAGLALAEDTDHWFAVRATSSANVQETNTDIICLVRIHEGALEAPAPNRISWATAVAIADGALEVSFGYDSADSPAEATAVKIADDSGGSLNWGAAATVAIAGTATYTTQLMGPYTHGRPLIIALRSVTAAGVASPHLVLSPVYPDSISPGTVPYITAAQEA